MVSQDGVTLGEIVELGGGIDLRGGCRVKGKPVRRDPGGPSHSGVASTLHGNGSIGRSFVKIRRVVSDCRNALRMHP